MDSKLLVGLIKEVVKSEVKQQVKEELAKLIKSGAVTLNSQRKTSTPSLKEMTEVNTISKQTTISTTPNGTSKTMKEFTKNPVLNEILNMTTPFTSAQRSEGGMPGMGGGSILDAIQPETYEENDWETMDYRTANVPQQQMNSTDGSGMDALTKALSRDYTELVKRFK